MRNILITAFVFAVTTLSAQSDCNTIQKHSFKQSESKDGKVTKKECIYTQVCTDVVAFRVSQTSIQEFYRIDGSNVWVDGATQKIVQRVEQQDGIVVFWKNERTAFAYPTK
jgi:hypothetical protein